MQSWKGEESWDGLEAIRRKEHQGHTRRNNGILTKHHAVDADGEDDDIRVDYASSNKREYGGRNQ